MRAIKHVPRTVNSKVTIDHLKSIVTELLSYFVVVCLQKWFNTQFYTRFLFPFSILFRLYEFDMDSFIHLASVHLFPSILSIFCMFLVRSMEWGDFHSCYAFNLDNEIDLIES